jgi:ABC-type glycerol-3-phosphate transport system substrate-binding protein
MTQYASRRRFLQTTAGASAAMLAYGAGHRFALAQDPTAVPTAEPIDVGEGGTEILMWVQDFGPAVDAFRKSAEAYVAAGNDVKVTVQPIAFADLLAKMLPSIAAGNEADIMMGYTDWYVATDVSQLFLQLNDFIGSQEELEATLFPSTLQTIDMPEGAIYYIPWLAGVRAAVTTYNGALYGGAGIDPATLATWEDMVAAGQQLTTADVAGLSPVSSMLSMVKNWIWQVGGEFYNLETGEWTLATPEGEAALQRLSDLVSGESPTFSYDLATMDNEFDVWMQGKIATHMNGAWTIGVSDPALEAGGIPTPLLAEHSVDVVYPEHIGVITLSRRLADDEAKRDHCINIAKGMVTADALIDVTNQYSGLICSKAVYDDPRIAETAFGPVSKALAEATWPRARWPKDHVANQAPAATELDRALRGEISVQEALGNADAYLNDQEQQARERIGL